MKLAILIPTYNDRCESAQNAGKRVAEKGGHSGSRPRRASADRCGT